MGENGRIVLVARAEPREGRDDQLVEKLVAEPAPAAVAKKNDVGLQILTPVGNQ
jgi:hypothetical protein